MSEKKKDRKGRWSSNAIAYRVTPDVQRECTLSQLSLSENSRSNLMALTEKLKKRQQVKQDDDILKSKTYVIEFIARIENN